MTILNDLPALLGIWIAGVLLLVAVSGMAARWGIRPVLDSVARMRSAGRAGDDERFAGLEAQVRALAAAVETMADRLERERAAQP